LARQVRAAHDPASAEFAGALGATGAMLIGILIDELERQGKRYGLATMCVGIGMGIATIIERV
jgi:acetyl-CoA acetyltransferase